MSHVRGRHVTTVGASVIESVGVVTHRSTRLGIAAALSLLFGASCAPTTRGGAPLAPLPTVAPEPTAEVRAVVAASDDEPALRPCAASPEADDARTAIAALSKRVEALLPTDDPKPLAGELVTLLDGPCFRLIRWDLHELGAAFDASASLRAFFGRGGRAWLEQVLHYDEPADGGGRVSTTPPTPRKTLTLDVAPSHPLAALLCREGDAACGAETVGWQRRADRFFELFGLVKHLERRGAAPRAEQSACEARALTKPVLRRFAEFRACMRESETPRTMFPLGRFRAPREGWFFVRGRRGHHSFCDEVRAYDLASGSAYVVRSCSGLVLRDGGSVDGKKTDAAREAKDEVGRVSADAIREAAWMALFASEVQHDAVHGGLGWYIPPSIEVAHAGGVSGGSFGGSFRSNSSQTELTYAWVTRGSVVKSGTLTWAQDFNDAAREHAVSLLAIAEASFVAGCPPTALPSPLVAGPSGKGGVSRLDADPVSLSTTQRELEDKLARFKGTKVCGAK